MERIFVQKGEKVIYHQTTCIIVKIISVDMVSIEEVDTNTIHTVSLKELEPFIEGENSRNELLGLNEEQWEKAKNRYEIIKPILEKPRDLYLIKSICSKNKIGVSSVYRWLRAYRKSGLISSLADQKRNGGSGKSRLSDVIENILKDKINTVYLNKSRKSIVKTIREVQIACKDLSIEAPHPNTIRNRIKDISDEEKIRKRYGAKEAKYKYEPLLGHFPGADYPLSVVQIDHTEVDIILVDEQYRKPVKRPWITVAIDVYSRMILGFHLSFDSPGYFGTGICVANSILPKELWLERIAVKADWPCWGIMDTLHMDNAKEFRGHMLKRVCKNYGINTQFRMIGEPHWGGHIERLLGTFSKEIHNLPGTVFSSVEDRKNYDSQKDAAFTLREFERWITIFITKIYHQRIHSGIDNTPINRYKEGIMGDKNNPGKGIPPRLNNERIVRIDFLPQIERTIQEYGIVIHHIFYYSDVMRSFIHDSENGVKKKHIFKINPRDISIIYFYDPIRCEYFEVPFRNTTLPPISTYEYNEIVKLLKERRIKVDEDSIFESFKELNEIELLSIKKTRQSKRKAKKTDYNIPQLEQKKSEIKEEFDVENVSDLTPFEDIDDGLFIR